MTLFKTAHKTGAVNAMDTQKRAELAEQHHLYSQRILEEMAEVEIVLNEAGLTLILPNRNTWEPDSMAEGFAEMPTAFARPYLQLRIRHFLYETFCESDTISSPVLDPALEAEASSLDAPAVESEIEAPMINDRIGGGLHVGLLEQFELSNQGNGYFDPGWQVVAEEPDGAIAVQKYGVVLHVERHHLSAERQADKRGVQPDELLDIRLPCYRFEPDFYIAVGDQGPVIESSRACEIYFAASTIALPLIMKALTTALNEGEFSIPYTLQVPYEPEGYVGPEAIVLRIEKAAFEKTLPLLQQIWELCQAEASSLASTTNLAGTNQPVLQTAVLRSDTPLFSDLLWPGISQADVIDSGVTDWFGSSAELSRIDLVAEALTQAWYDCLADSLDAMNNQFSAGKNLSAIQARFAQAQLFWERPSSRLVSL
jgi:hypothetical protein